MAEKHSSKGIMWAVIIIAVVLIAVLYPLTVKKSTSAADAAFAGSDQAEIRIQPVARFQMAKAEAAAATGPKDGPTVYNSVCGACHNTGAAGAPKIDAKGDWAPRLGAGLDGLTKSVIAGKGAMPPKGGSTLSDDEIKGAVEYILSKVK